MDNAQFIEIATLISAFSFGFLSSVHCVGMCGGIAGALSLSIPGGRRASRWLQVFYSACYNFGRIFSYGVAGTIAAGVSFETITFFSPDVGLIFLRILSAVILVFMGFYLAGWFPSFATLEHVGIPLWRRLEPLGRRFMPLKSPLYAFAYGAIWGWLPCGLVYSVLLYSASSGSALQGGLTMIMFGVGTLPAVFGISMASQWFLAMRRKDAVRKVVGLTVVVLGIASLVYTGGLFGEDCAVCGVDK